jgi:PII-like signaling protein
MTIPTDSLLLRIFVGENARHGHQPLYEAIVLKAHEARMAGATVFRGAMGYGKSSHVHTAKILALSDDLPVVIEIVESEARINAFMADLLPMMASGMATLEKVRAFHFAATPPSA